MNTQNLITVLAHAEACRKALDKGQPRPFPAVRDLSRSCLSGSNLSGIDLSGCDLRCADLSGSDLSYSDLSRSDLSRSNLNGSNLLGSDLRDCNLSGSDLSGCDLRDSDLRGTILVGCDLHDCDLRGSDLRDSDLSDSGCRVWISDKYTAYTVPGENGRILHFGCERHTLDVWEEKVKELCERYEPVHAARYEAEIQALVALCRVIPEGR